MNILGSSLRQERAHGPFMNGRAVPDHQQFVRHVRQHMLQKDHHKLERSMPNAAMWKGQLSHVRSLSWFGACKLSLRRPGPPPERAWKSGLLLVRRAWAGHAILMTSIIWTSALEPAAPVLDAVVLLSAITMTASVSAQARNPMTRQVQWLQEQNEVASDFARVQMSKSDSLQR
jgi:hypothetical protein